MIIIHYRSIIESHKIADCVQTLSILFWIIKCYLIETEAAGYDEQVKSPIISIWGPSDIQMNKYYLVIYNIFDTDSLSEYLDSP